MVNRNIEFFGLDDVIPGNLNERVPRARQDPHRAQLVSIAASSDRMSPKMLPVTITSNAGGACTSCAVALSGRSCR
jgi:hypothetical protein